MNDNKELTAYELLKQILLEAEEEDRIDILTKIICDLDNDHVIDVDWVEIY